MKEYANKLKWVLLLGYFPVMMAFVSVNKSSLICSNVVVSVSDSLNAGFVSSGEIRKMVIRNFPELLGSVIGDIDFEEIEATIEKHPAIRCCQVFNNSYGVLNVKVKQHEPIMRVYSGNSSYYLDADGTKIPVSGKYSARVLIVNGNIPTNKEDLIKVSRFITENSFWNAQMEQIYIRRNNDYVLVPRVGEHLILLGNSEHIDEKMNNLMNLYEIFDPQEWNKYKTINLKFKNQVICSKNGTF